MRTWLRAMLVVVALIVGAFLPALAPCAWLLRWLLMVMLFSAFLDLPWRRPAGLGRVALLAVLPVAMALAAWGICRLLAPELAPAAALAALAPTATAAPVIVVLIGGDLAFITAAVLAGNLLAVLVLPLALGWLAPQPPAVLSLAMGIAATLLVPLAAAALLRLAWPAAPRRLAPLRQTMFPLWCLGLAIAGAAAAEHLRSADLGWRTLTGVATTTAVICAANFAVGRWIGGAQLGREGAQALGQKNTLLVIWCALAAGAPGAALGPTCYVFWHNLANAWQLARRPRMSKKKPTV